MEHIILIFYLLSIIAGVASISIALFIYFALYKKRVILYFTAFISSMLFIIVELMLIKYMKVIEYNGNLLELAVKSIDVVGVTTLLFSMPIFLAELFSMKYKKYMKIIFRIFIPSVFILLIIYKISELEILRYIGQFMMFSEMIFVLILSIGNINGVGDKNIKTAIRVLGIIAILFFPILIFEALRDNIIYFKNLDFLEIFSLPLMFFVVNILSIIFTIKLFNRPYYIENNSITDYFCKRFNITEREKEIIELVIKGHTYKMIGEELYIAYKTVDNHMQNIYEKTAVKSKIQLINLLQSNRN